MSLKSSIMFKLAQKMSKFWIKFAGPPLETTIKFNMLISQVRAGISQKVFRLKTYPLSKPSSKNQDVVYLPRPFQKKEYQAQ